MPVVPITDGKSRDARLDALRGLFLLIMAAVHVPTPLSHLLQEPFGYTSAAEGFVFLGACLAGFVYGKTYLRADWAAMARRAWIRARQIYFVHLALVVPFALFAWALGDRLPALANHFHDFLEHPCASLALLPLLLHQPPLFDILPLYVIFLGATPFVLASARSRGWGIVLLVSGLCWLAAQFNTSGNLIGEPSRLLPVRLGPFSLLAWQFLWCGGLALGQTALREGRATLAIPASSRKHEAPNSKLQHPEKRQAPTIHATPRAFGIWSLKFLWSLDIGAWRFLPRGATKASAQPRRMTGTWRLALGVAAAVLVLAGLLSRHGCWPHAWFSPDLYLWMDKWTLGPLRLLNFAAWVVLLLCWRPSLPSLLSPLALLGRHALTVFALHVPAAILATIIIQTFALPSPVQTGIGLLVIASIFAWAALQESFPRSGASLGPVFQTRS